MGLHKYANKRWGSACELFYGYRGNYGLDTIELY